MKDIIVFNKESLNNFSNNKKINLLKKYIFKEKKIVILRSLFKNFSEIVIKEAGKRTRKKPRFFKPNFNCSDQYIYNKNFKKSKVRGYYKKVLLFPWNKSNARFFKKTENLIKLKENLIKNNFSKIKKKYNVIQIMNYPAKKGYLSNHKDSNLHKECVIQIATDNFNLNDEGGLFVTKGLKNFNLDSIAKKGDLLIFSKGLRHFVKKDPAKSRWSIIIGDFQLS